MTTVSITDGNITKVYPNVKGPAEFDTTDLLSMDNLVKIMDLTSHLGSSEADAKLDTFFRTVWLAYGPGGTPCTRHANDIRRHMAEYTNTRAFKTLNDAIQSYVNLMTEVKDSY